MTDDDIIQGIIRREGSTYTNNPADRGGPTKYGITLNTLRQFHHGADVGADEVESLTEDVAVMIYRVMFIERPGFSKIRDTNLRTFCIDWGVNSGPAVPIKKIQFILGLDDDGELGPVTASAINTADPVDLLKRMIASRHNFYIAIVQHDPSQRVFFDGWENRLKEWEV